MYFISPCAMFDWNVFFQVWKFHFKFLSFGYPAWMAPYLQLIKYKSRNCKQMFTNIYPIPSIKFRNLSFLSIKTHHDTRKCIKKQEKCMWFKTSLFNAIVSSVNLWYHILHIRFYIASEKSRWNYFCGGRQKEIKINYKIRNGTPK
jgi:hypothetical protein